MGLDTVELVVAVEKHFSIAIPDGDAADADTVGKLAQIIERLRLASGHPIPRDEIVSRLKHLISDMFDIPVESIAEASQFRKDLGLD